MGVTYDAPAYCAICDHPIAIGPFCEACMDEMNEEEDQWDE